MELIQNQLIPSFSQLPHGVKSHSATLWIQGDGQSHPKNLAKEGDDVSEQGELRPAEESEPAGELEPEVEPEPEVGPESAAASLAPPGPLGCPTEAKVEEDQTSELMMKMESKPAAEPESAAELESEPEPEAEPKPTAKLAEEIEPARELEPAVEPEPEMGPEPAAASLAPPGLQGCPTEATVEEDQTSELMMKMDERCRLQSALTQANKNLEIQKNRWQEEKSGYLEFLGSVRQSLQQTDGTIEALMDSVRRLEKEDKVSREKPSGAPLWKRFRRLFKRAKPPAMPTLSPAMPTLSPAMPTLLTSAAVP